MVSLLHAARDVVVVVIVVAVIVAADGRLVAARPTEVPAQGHCRGRRRCAVAAGWQFNGIKNGQKIGPKIIQELN